MAMTTAALQANLHNVLDQVLETGKPVGAQRDRPSRLDRLTPHPDAVTGDPADLVDIDWSDEWRPFL